MLTDPPAADVIEISVFGPGRGESIAVHLGEGRWVVVDSCISQSGDVPVLSYLSRIGVEVASQVHLVTATHTHNDHFAGIARIFSACLKAKFVCSVALMAPEFIALTDLEEQDHAGLPVRAYSEYSNVFRMLEERIVEGIEPVQYAQAQLSLYANTGHQIPCEVTALSPSSKAFKRAMRSLRKAVPLADVASTIRLPDANDFAVAMWIEAGDKRLLLGADLPKGPQGFGWHAVLAGPRPHGKASVYKVSHHGSVTGHRPGVWSELLIKKPVALLTPYRAGSKTVPNESERQQICSLTNRAYITAPPIGAEMASAIARQERASLGSLARNVKIETEVGQIRARSRVGSRAWNVELIEPAQKLT
jgi:Metallo-beta-lactamase superfamily